MWQPLVVLVTVQAYRTGMTTLTNAVSGQSQNCSGNLEISPDTWKFFRETRDNSGTLQKKSRDIEKFYCTFLFKIREDDPNFRDDLN